MKRKDLKLGNAAVLQIRLIRPHTAAIRRMNLKNYCPLHSDVTVPLAIFLKERLTEIFVIRNFTSKNTIVHLTGADIHCLLSNFYRLNVNSNIRRRVSIIHETKLLTSSYTYLIENYGTPDDSDDKFILRRRRRKR